MKNNIVRQLLQYLDNNIYAKVSMDDLSRIFYFNKDYLMRVFKKELNCTIIDYMNKTRIYHSLKELKETDDMILKVALKHGFTSQEYYTEIFRKTVGINTEKEKRKQIAEQYGVKVQRITQIF